MVLSDFDPEGEDIAHSFARSMRDDFGILFCAIEAKFWDHFCRAVDREDLLGDHRRDLVVDFAANDDVLRGELQRIFSTRTLAASREFPKSPCRDGLRPVARSASRAISICKVPCRTMPPSG